MNAMISDVTRFESASRQFDDATSRLFSAFGIADGKFTAEGSGRYVPGTDLQVRTASSVRGLKWRIDRSEQHPRLVVTIEGEECVMGVVESRRLRDDFGHVAYVVDQSPYEHVVTHSLMITTGIMEER